MHCTCNRSLLIARHFAEKNQYYLFLSDSNSVVHHRLAPHGLVRFSENRTKSVENSTKSEEVPKTKVTEFSSVPYIVAVVVLVLVVTVAWNLVNCVRIQKKNKDKELKRKSAALEDLGRVNPLY